MNQACIVEYFEELSATNNLAKYARKVGEKYTEGTLMRLLMHSDPCVREAALTALRLRGSMNANRAVARCLHDSHPRIVEAAEQTLWALWFRASTAAHNQELHRIAEIIADEQYGKALEALNRLVEKSPRFAEARNQRAIVQWKLGNYQESVADCRSVLDLNPVHFGAAAGMAQCYLLLYMPEAALRAFRRALRIHPTLHGVSESIEELEQLLRERRQRRDDR